jgi:hypothetical protein
LNAVKSTYRRKETADAEQTKYIPSVVVRFEPSGSELRCVLEDNGAACSDADERAKLDRSFDAAKMNPFNPNSRSFGLSFCVVAVRAQGGRVELVTKTSTLSTVNVYLPLILPGTTT